MNRVASLLNNSCNRDFAVAQKTTTNLGLT